MSTYAPISNWDVSLLRSELALCRAVRKAERDCVWWMCWMWTPVNIALWVLVFRG